MKPLLNNLIGSFKFIVHQRFKSRKIASSDDLTKFVASRAAYIAQTSLYGYLKTRMGTQYRYYFEDEEFSKVIHTSAVLLFVSCLADLTVHSVKLLIERGGLPADRGSEIAQRIFEAGLREGVSEADRNKLPADAAERFQDRAAKTVWAGGPQGESAFRGSIEDLVKFAPVVDEFKALDKEIVTNSIRFRWRDVREQLRMHLRAEDVAQSIG